jgi:DNA/RNA endonuclease YhcR with UshA esterase domain
MSVSNKGPGVDSRLQNLTNALYLDLNNDVVVRTGFAGNIVISGNVNVPGNIAVYSSPTLPVHSHITEIGTSDILTVPWMPVAGNISLDASTNLIGNVKISQMPGIAVTSMPEVEIKNNSGNPITVTGSVTTIGGSAQGKLWTMQVAQGLIAGHTVEQVTGYNPSTSAGDAVWSGGTAYPWSSFNTAQTLYLKSSTNNATDRSMSILIDGLDANYANQTEVITLNASDSRTAVATTKQFLRIHNIYCNGADTNVGDIITTVTSGTGTVVSKISAGRGSARAGCFTIPAGYTGYLFKGDASSTAATVVNFMARYYGKAFMVVHVAIVDNSTYIYDFPFPMPLPEKTDMYCTIEAGSGKTAINYEILLVAN